MYQKQYNLAGEFNGVLRIEDGAWIPLAHGNTDYETYLAWVAAGNVPLDRALADYQAAQIGAINAACQAAIFAGFTSSALGAAHTYPAKSLDQQNLSASVLASLMPNLPVGWTTPFWCADANGAWAYVQHTAAQIQQVGQDGKAAILAALNKNQTLQGQIMSATTPAEVQAVVWA